MNQLVLLLEREANHVELAETKNPKVFAEEDDRVADEVVHWQRCNVHPPGHRISNGEQQARTCSDHFHQFYLNLGNLGMISM